MRQTLWSSSGLMPIVVLIFTEFSCIYFCRSLKDGLQLKPDTLDIIAKLPVAKKHSDIFDWKGPQLEKKFRGRLELLKIYTKFLASLRWALLEVSHQQDGQKDTKKRVFIWKDQVIRLDFTVCSKPECSEDDIIMATRK